MSMKNHSIFACNQEMAIHRGGRAGKRAGRVDRRSEGCASETRRRSIRRGRSPALQPAVKISGASDCDGDMMLAGLG
jgi:hypothetical protein